MKFLAVVAVVLAVVAAQDEDEVPPGRTRICKDGEFPGKRVRRQAAPGPDAPKPCWFIPDDSITSGDDCEQKYKETNVCEKSQVFVPLGVTKICIKFEAAPKWFLSEGTNGYCGHNDCCEWYPKETSKVIFCSPKRPLLNWFEAEDGVKCNEVENPESKAQIGVEIIKGEAFTDKTICLAVGKPEDEEGVKFVDATAELSENCGGGCCIFKLQDASKK